MGWDGEEIGTGPEDRCDTSKDCLHVRQCIRIHAVYYRERERAGENRMEYMYTAERHGRRGG